MGRILCQSPLSMKFTHWFRLNRFPKPWRFLAWLMVGFLMACLGCMFQPGLPQATATTLTTPTGSIPQALFGMHVYDPAKVGWPTVPIGSNRIFYPWLFLEPKDNQWNFTELDQRISISRSKNARILFVLNDTPTWASARPSEVGEWGAENPGTAAEPKDMQIWQDFIRTIATRYKGKVTAYQIWNEPNNSRDYSGSIEKMVEMSKVAYQTLKQIDPNIAVVSPGAILSNDSWLNASGLDWYDKFFAAGGGQYIDVVGPHLYMYDKLPEDRVAPIQSLRQLMSKYGIANKRIWDTENGYANLPDRPAYTQSELQGFATRPYIINWATGVSRFFWFAWDIDRNYNKLWVFMTQDDYKTLTPAGIAFGEVQKWLVGATMQGCSVDVNQTWICQISRSGLPLSRVVWNPRPGSGINFSIPSSWQVKNIRTLDRQSITPPLSGTILVNQAPRFLES